MYRKIITAIFAGCIGSTTAYSQTNELNVLHFEELKHGQIVDQPLDGVSVASTNLNVGYSIRAFDTRIRQSEYPGLEGADGITGQWNGGNLKHDIVLGKALAIMPHEGLADDEMRAAVSFEFSHPVDEFGLDVINIAEDDEQSHIAFYDGDDLVGMVKLNDFINPTKDLYDPTIEYGDRTANRIRPITADDVDAVEFTRVELHIATKDGAIDNVTYKKAKPLASVFTDIALPASTFDNEVETSGTLSTGTAPLQGSSRFVVLPTSSGGVPLAAAGVSSPELFEQPDPTPPDDPNNPIDPPDTPVVPIPGAAVAGLALLGLLGFKRNRY
ncbi:hypothetical protein JD969_06210 [Planctomycetota bacterium]|nr:hypothetical protein JD969_06210 [Planctomycetota bacterium]